METGLVSVIMPLYNAERYVREAIESIIEQSYCNWELIIVDDGSSDSSLLVANQYRNEKIHVFFQMNRGACAARNFALNKAKGEYIKFLDSDDVLYKDCLSCQVESIKKMKGYQIPFGDYNVLNQYGKLEKKQYLELLDELALNQELFFYNHWEVLISAPLHRHELLKKLGYFDEKLPRGQEYDLHFRLALSGCEFIYCPCETFMYRCHGDQSRISNQFNTRSYSKTAHFVYRYEKFERLLIDKYGAVPQYYYNSFHKFWFSRARDAFAEGYKEDGVYCMSKARLYDRKNPFFTFYSIIGSLVGYIPMEKMLRLRVRMLSAIRKEQH